MMSPYTARSFLDARGLSAPSISPIGHGVAGGVLGVCGEGGGVVTGVGMFGVFVTDGVGEGVSGGV